MADPDSERIKQAQDQNSRNYGGPELGWDMGLFYQITLKCPISKTEPNRSVLQGFSDNETVNRSPIRGYFTMGRTWFCHDPSLFPDGIVDRR